MMFPALRNEQNRKCMKLAQNIQKRNITDIPSILALAEKCYESATTAKFLTPPKIRVRSKNGEISYCTSNCELAPTSEFSVGSCLYKSDHEMKSYVSLDGMKKLTNLQEYHETSMMNSYEEHDYPNPRNRPSTWSTFLKSSAVYQGVYRCGVYNSKLMSAPVLSDAAYSKIHLATEYRCRH
jgi:hypothetical protein